MKKNIGKRIVSAILSVIMVVGMMPISVFSAPGLTNYAQGKTVKGYVTGKNTPLSVDASILTDGDKTQYVYGGAGTYGLHTYEVDLGADVEGINEIKVGYVKSGNHGTPEEYSIYVKASDGDWKMVSYVVNPDNSVDYPETVDQFANEKVRYVRVCGELASMASARGMFISEIEVYANPNVDIEPSEVVIPEPTTENLASGKIPTIYKGENYTASLNNENAYKATDGDFTTYVYGGSGVYSQHTYEIDLGKDVVDLNEIRTAFWKSDGGGTPRDYAIDVKSSTGDWERVAEVTDAINQLRSNKVVHNFLPKTVRYIRVIGTSEVAGRAMYLAEVEAYVNPDKLPVAEAATVTLMGGSQKGAAVNGWNVAKWCPDVMDTIKIDVQDAEGVTSTVTIDDEPYNIGDDIKLTTSGEMTVKVVSSASGLKDRTEEFVISVPESIDIDENYNFAKDANVKFLDADLNEVGAKSGKIASNAVDGNEETTAVADVVAHKVSTNTIGEAWTLEVDLGAVVSNVNNIKMLFGTRSLWVNYPQYIYIHKTLVSPKQFKIEGSVDGDEWFTVYDHVAYSVESAKYERDIVFDPVSVRYLRMTDTEPTLPTATSDGRTYQMEIGEFEVYVNDRTPEVSTSTIKNLAMGATLVWKGATGKDLPYGGYPGNVVTYNSVNAFDCDLDTFTYGAQEYNPDAFITLASKYENVDQIKLYFSGSAPAKYSVEVSEDNSTWNKVAEFEDDAELFKDITFEPQFVKYIRVTDHAKKQGAIGLAELEVYSPSNGKKPSAATNASVKWTDFTGEELSTPAANKAEYAVDNNEESFTYTTEAIKTIFEIEMVETAEEMNQIVIEFEKNGNRGVPDFFDVLISTDGVNWKVIKEYTSEGEFEDRDSTVVIDFYPTPAKYIKIKDPSNTEEKDQIMSIAEVCVYENAEANVGVNFALDSDNSFSSKEGWNLPASIGRLAEYATDGDYDTVSCAGGQYQWYLTTDMKELKKDINEIKIVFGNGQYRVDQCVPTWFRVNVSQDGKTWETVYNVYQATNKEKIHNVYFDKKDIRYIQVCDMISQTNDYDGSPMQMTISEVEAYSTIRKLEGAENILKGKPIKMLNEYGLLELEPKDAALTSAKFAVDEDTSSVACPDYDTNWMLEADLGKVVKGVTEARVTFGYRGFDDDSVPESFEIQTSEDGKKWHAVAKSTSQEKDQRFILPAVPMRYARLVDTSANVDNIMVVGEFQLFVSGAKLPDSEPMRILDTYPKTLGPFFNPREDEYYIYFNKPVESLTEIRKYVYFAYTTYTNYNLDETGTILKLSVGGGLSFSMAYRVLVMPGGNIDFNGDLVYFTCQSPRTDGALDIGKNAVASFIDPNTGETLPASKGRVAEFATDGDLTTVAVAERKSKNDVYITQFDLGKVYDNLAEIRFTLGSSTMSYRDFHTMNFKVITSVDGINWDDASLREKFSHFNDVLINFSVRPARYVRIQTLNPNEIFEEVPVILGISSFQAYEGQPNYMYRLRVASTDPIKDQKSVDMDKTITIKFNRMLTDEDYTPENIKLVNAKTGEVVETTLSIDNTKTIVKMDPVNDLEGNCEYQITVNPDILADGYSKDPISFYTKYVPTYGGENLALGGKEVLLKPNVEFEYSSSDVLGRSGGTAGYNNDFTVDGDMETFVAAGGYWQWQIQVDLQETKQDINEIRVYFAEQNGTPMEYEVYTSVDGVYWNPVLTEKADSADSKETVKPIFMEPRPVRYIRVKDLLPKTYGANGNQIQMTISEIEVYSNDNIEEQDFAVTRTYPKDGANLVSVDQEIVAIFTKPVDSLNDFECKLVNAKSGSEIECEVTLDTASGTMITVAPAQSLAFGTTYKLLIDGEAVCTFTTEQVASQRPNLAIGSDNVFLKPNVKGKYNDGDTLPHSSAYVASNATDGKKTTGAVAANYWQYQLQVDLKEIKTDVNDIRIFFGLEGDDGDSAVPLEFQLLTSVDGENWDVIKTVKYDNITSRVKYEKITFAPRDVRYIRVKDMLEYEYNTSGSRIQMIIGELEVHNVDDTVPLETLITPYDGSEGLETGVNVEFEFNKRFSDDYVITLKDNKGKDIEFTTSVDTLYGRIVVDPVNYLKPGMTYTATISSETDEYEYSTTFTTVEVASLFEILTQSSTAYSEHNKNAIYPLFVDNYEYQHWSTDLEGGVAEYFQFETSGASGDVTWEVIRGELPDGMELTSDGKFQGLATKEGTFSFSVRATDEEGKVAEKTLTVVANPYRAKWHYDAKFGMMVQWGTFTTPAITNKNDIPVFEDRIYNFDADEWMDEVAASGAKIFNFTVLGGDAIRLWPSTTPSVNEYKTQRNIAKELIDAAHERGIKFIAYMPIMFGWGNMYDKSAIDGTYSTLNIGLCSELIDMGVDGFWFDSGASWHTSSSYINWEELMPVIREKNPFVTISANSGNSGLVNRFPYTDIITYEGFADDAELSTSIRNYSRKKMGKEIDQLMGGGWAWTPDVEASLRPAEDIIQNIKDNWDIGTTYMTAIATPTDGRLMTDNTREHLKDVYDWVNRNIDSYPFDAKDTLRDNAASVNNDDNIFTAFKQKEGQSMIKSVINGDHDYELASMGMRFITGASPLILTHLGRYKLDGNDQVHSLRIQKQWSNRMIPLRIVDLDLSTTQADEDGFAYVELEYPILLEPNTAYYIFSTENTTDTIAKPNFEAFYSEFDVSAAGPIWSDIAFTRPLGEDVPGETDVTSYVSQKHPSAVGGGLVNFKAVITADVKNASVAQGKYAWLENLSGQKISSSGNVGPTTLATDGNDATAMGAGDGAWASRYCIDFGEIVERVNKVTVKFTAPYFPLTILVYGSKDGKNFELLKNTINDSGTNITISFEPRDLRYIKIEQPTIPGDNLGIGRYAVWNEIYVFTENLAYSATAKFVRGLTNSAVKERDEISFATYAIDNNKYTKATAETAKSSLQLDLNGYYRIEQIKTISDNTALDYYVSKTGDKWQLVDMSEATIDDDGTITFALPISAKQLLISPQNSSEPVSITDIQIYGEKHIYTDTEEVVKPDPEQPPVGGGGGGSASEPSTPAPSEPTVETPTVKPGWAQKENGQWTYGGQDGKATIGWAKIDGIWYHFDDNGIMQTGWYKDTDGKWYYFDANGAMTIGWVHDGNTWYHTNSSGVMQTGWIMVDSKWYYLNSSGAMVTGWRKVSASWYYFKPNGVMVTGWQLIGGKWYYMHATGSMAFNQWIETNGKWYYVTNDGSMAVNTVIDGYKVDENGVWVK